MRETPRASPPFLAADGRRVLVFGDVVTDILVDLVERTTADSDTRAVVRSRFGGSGANQAAWLAHRGAAVSFVGRVGTADHAGQRAALADAGVDVHLAVDPELPTGRVVVLVDRAAGTRTMYVDRGANQELCWADFPADCLDTVSCLHLTGYSLFDPSVRATALRLVAEARRRGIAVSVDPSSVAFLRQAGAARFIEWTSGATLLFPNFEEAAHLTGRPEPTEAVGILAEHYGTVVVKMGKSGALCGSRRSPVLAMAATAAEVVDPTGTGDAFCAGFLAAWMNREPMEKALASAAASAAEALATIGARPPGAALDAPSSP